MSISFLTSSGKLTGQNFWANEQLRRHSCTIQYGKSLSRGHVGSSRSLCQPDLVRWPLFLLWFLKHFSHHFHWWTLGVCWKLYHLKTKIIACRQERCVLEKKKQKWKTKPKNKPHICKITSLLHTPCLVVPIYRIFQSYHTAFRTKINNKARDLIHTHLFQESPIDIST